MNSAEEEAALLAELRAISNQSAASRFDDNSDDDDVPAMMTDGPLLNGSSNRKGSMNEESVKTAANVVQEEKRAEGTTLVETIQDENAASQSRRSVSKRPNGEVPPWKRKRQPQKESSSSNINNKHPMSVEVEVIVATPPTKTKPPPSSTSSSSSPPPQVINEGDTETITVAVTNSPNEQETTIGVSDHFHQSSTYQGDRGGDANDEELLALLKMVSNKSGAADRFAEDNGETETTEPTHAVRPVPSQKQSPPKPNTSPGKSRKSRDPNILPPWKRGKSKNAASEASSDFSNVDVVLVTAPPTLTLPDGVSVSLDVHSSGSTAGPMVETHDSDPSKLSASERGFRQESTFQGERGGEANDAELLALLRNVSAKSNATDRFAGEDDSTIDKKADLDGVVSQPKPKQNRAKQLLQWGRKKVTNSTNPTISESNKEEVVERNSDLQQPPTSPIGHSSDMPVDRQLQESVLLGGGGTFKQESTFQGERGGIANDPELYALLRNVSATAAAADRFADTGEMPPVDSKSALATSKNQQKSQSKLDDRDLTRAANRMATHNPAAANDTPINFVGKTSPGMLAAPPTPFPEVDGEEAIVVSKDDLPGAFSDSNWKVRKEAYNVLNNAILEAAKCNNNGNVDASDILVGLDDLIPKLLAEKNATALEFAMNAASCYASTCAGGSSADCAQTIMSSLFKGSAFTSPRPSSVTVVTDLVMKLIEVGSSTESATVVINALVNQGLTSKKPKVVQQSASLILEATQSFGAASLPLAAIASALPKVLSHSNKKIRDCGMEIVAEFCRALGSKSPMEEVIGKMQKSQVKDLDTLLENQSDPTPIKIGMRFQRSTNKSGQVPATSVSDALAALQAGGEELAKQRYANRPAINLFEELKKTEYDSKLKLTKWSEKVGALDIALKCGGEEPFKLLQPSSSCNYAPMISQMKGLLAHTHFAVVTKAMAVLAMLAQGVGEKLYPNLRPLLPKLLQLSKDKKLTKGVSSCLDAFFGNVLGFEHLLDAEASLSAATDESNEKNALARTTALDYLERCVTRGPSAGPRALLSAALAKSCADFATQKLSDSDANVRNSALTVLQALQMVENIQVVAAVASTIESLQQSNPRAYKTLVKSAQTKSTKAAGSSSYEPSSTFPSGSPQLKPPANKPLTPPFSKENPEGMQKEMLPSRQAQSHRIDRLKDKKPTSANEFNVPNLEDATNRCASMEIPYWDEPDEELGGVLAGLNSTKWQSRQSSIKAIAKFVGCRPIIDSRAEAQYDTECLLLLVKECTRGFKESNMNVMRSMLDLFLSLCEYHEKAQYPFPTWAAVDGASVAVEKIADRKLSSISKSVLLSICVVCPAGDFLPAVFSTIEKIRAPAAHEEFLKWMNMFCNEFGAHSFGSATSFAIAFLKDECSSKNVKVKRAAFSVLGLIHSQLGPSFRALVLAAFKESLREEAEKCFYDHPHDLSYKNAVWERVCLCSLMPNGTEDISSIKLELPKLDLISELPGDCISRMGSKDGKTAWKARKAAMEDVEKALKSSSGVIDASTIRPLIDLLRALKERLADSQSNLKPMAARLIGDILGSVEGDAQGKLGKVVYAPLINAAMNDNRKIMNDAAMEALQKGTSQPPIEGGGLNESSLETFVVALTTELEESEYKAAGIAGVLALTQNFTQSFQNLDNVSSQRGETLGGRFASVLVDALSSSKADIRASAELLLSDCVTNGVFSKQTVRRCIARLVPAKQRSVGSVLAKITSVTGDEGQKHDTNSPGMECADDSKLISTKGVKERKPMGTQRIGLEKHSSTSINATPSSSKKVYHNTTTDPSFHPLVFDAGTLGSQKSRAAMRSLTWPEYPEEPSGSSLYSGLRKAWAPLIHPDTVKLLFPDSGIRKQDDAIPGFNTLKAAIEMERAGQGTAVVQQIGFILRWSVFVMSCKESTVGLTGLLEMLLGLIDYLQSLKYEFSDGETMLFVPFLFEKASISKGRFKETYDDLVLLLKAGRVIPTKKLGPLVCVAMMESSTHAKARLMACQDCYECVASTGLSGIGKKGVLVAAKSLSEEKLPENKAAYLDLMVLLVSRMNNDIQRLSKICGSSLSTKARSLVEERMKKVEKEGGLLSPAKSSGIPSRLDESSSKASKLPRSIQNTPVSTSFPRSTEFEVATKPSILFNDETMHFQDELPALDLRLGPKKTPTKTHGGLPQPSPPSSLPRLKLADKSCASQNDQTSLALGSTLTFPKEQSESLPAYLFPSSSGSLSDSSLKISGCETSQRNESIGAAASLRARLLKIREKNNGTGSTSGVEVVLTKSTSGGESAEDNSTKIHESLEQRCSSLKPVLTESLTTFKKLMEKSPPLHEDDNDVASCTDVLKNIHAAVSKQAHLAVDMDPANISQLREDIRDRISDVVSTLTRLIGIGFDCHDPSFNAGMSVPLLSVNLASLMAIFRSHDISTLVSVDDLTILIKEAGKALLDPRLSTTSKSSTVSLLDEATSTQMVRAINKLAVQAATGATRANAVLALVRLQEQLSFSSNGLNDPIFNSRLSRIVSKLMSRVIKAEESSAKPYDPTTVDMEAVICCLDDTLEASTRSAKEGNKEGVGATENLAKLLVVSILKSRGEKNTFVDMMKELEIDPSSSPLGALVVTCATELGIASDESSTAQFNKKPDVAALVSAVGSATDEASRNQAVLALMQYKEVNGDSDLNDHLQNVSAAFREFVLQQLCENPDPQPPVTSNNSMSERIKSLRSKLNATEAVIQSTSANRLAMESSSGIDTISLLTSSSGLEEKEESSSGTHPQPSLQAFRDRLAASHEKRATAGGGSSGDVQLAVPATTAGGRAAALRARLQAVKMQTNLMEDEK
ncbi:hypothetical protein IV203_017926 [Nitzschia inconspicua]|uniref:TOG domain-containing protein n=1 Tax=Nitzschia inconspicua TaxID=303405 RepID=A0A9K3M124_9STRA|nr:hypothetical protein IV203_017926 [Nitzschia inconspicua]